MNISQSATDKLRDALTTLKKQGKLDKKLQEKEKVYNRYKPLFAPDNIPNLTKEEFRSFLYFRNNMHWTGLYRSARFLLNDMDLLRKELLMLLDEDKPLPERFHAVLKNVKGLGKALATAILHMVYPEKYGVWNNVTESALKILDIWPDFPKGTGVGQKYEKLNEIFLHLSKLLKVDLWILDWLWWEIVKENEGRTDEDDIIEFEDEQYFRLERHLHNFLVDNWDKTILGNEWEIYKEPDDDLKGFEFPTGIGRIDILARHKNNREWLVIEVKRGRAADDVVGQLLRYIGWVRKHLAGHEENVRGLIISADHDEKLQYALYGINQPPISFMRYHIKFELVPVLSSEEE